MEKHGKTVDTIQLVPLERMAEAVSTYTAEEFVQVTGPSRQSRRKSCKELNLSFDAAAHVSLALVIACIALAPPPAGSSSDTSGRATTMNLLMSMVTYTEVDLAAVPIVENG